MFQLDIKVLQDVVCVLPRPFEGLWAIAAALWWNQRQTRVRDLGWKSEPYREYPHTRFVCGEMC